MNNNEKCSEIAVRNLWPAVYRMILQNEPNLGYGHINYEFLPRPINKGYFSSVFEVLKHCRCAYFE